MTIDLYYTPGSGPCQYVILTAKLLGLNVNLKELDLVKKEQLTPEFLKLNPQHTVPTLVDNGFVLWESHAIATYLVRQYGKNDSLYPKDPKKRAVVDQRLYFEIGTLHESFRAYYYPILLTNANPDPDKYTKIDETFKFLDGFLEGQIYVAGDSLTVADVSIAVMVATFDVAKFDITPYKNVSKWYAKIKTAIPDYEAVSGKETLTKLWEAYFKK